MARTRGFDETSVVVAARDVFWERGFASTSLAQLQEATGLSRSSMYETFGSKRGLFDRAAQNYLDEVIGPLLAPLERPDAGQEELVGYFMSLALWIRSSSPRIGARGCLMLNTAMSLNDLDADAVAMVRSYRQRVRAAIRHSLESFVEPADDPDGKADLLTAGQMGLMLTSRIEPLTAADLAHKIADDVRTW